MKFRVLVDKLKKTNLKIFNPYLLITRISYMDK